jgi:hypothetical protein
MTRYFEKFPTIEYEGVKVKDITRRNTFTKEVTNNPLLYMPYTIKEGERAQDIAEWYYGSVDYEWLVYMANNITDPYHEWPKSNHEFNLFLIDKYGEASGLTGEDIIDWTKEDNDENIIYYYKEV